jgi:hypothetical protein
MDLKELNKPVDVKDIEFRIQSISLKGYAVLLAYKDARYDMNILDEVVGPGYWKKEYKSIDGRLYCGVSIYNSDLKEWIIKWDVGSESMTQKEKGHASDSFKRACFNWGIGRELYDFPVIIVKLNDNEYKVKEYNNKKKAQQTWDLKLKEWKWHIERINGTISRLVAKDMNLKKVRFNYDKREELQTKK